MGRSDTRKSRVAASIVAIAVVAFAYGIAVGHYQVFPFEQLKSVKSMLDESSGRTPAEPIAGGKRVGHVNRIATHIGLDATADVVMVGDSITDYAEWSEMFPGVAIANRGIAGDTTEGILRRMETITATGAQTALIMVGVNDISKGMSADAVFTNYEQIIDRLRVSGIKPIIQSTTLLGEAGKFHNAEISRLNAMLRKLAANERLQFVDVNERLAPDGVLEDQFTTDAIHLSTSGYREWQAMIAPIIAEYSRGSGH